eukprot:Clim_evm37s77 gene=Clim_evmTU37s77
MLRFATSRGQPICRTGVTYFAALPATTAAGSVRYRSSDTSANKGSKDDKLEQAKAEWAPPPQQIEAHLTKRKAWYKQQMEQMQANPNYTLARLFGQLERPIDVDESELTLGCLLATLMVMENFSKRDTIRLRSMVTPDLYFRKFRQVCEDQPPVGWEVIEIHDHSLMTIPVAVQDGVLKAVMQPQLPELRLYTTLSEVNYNIGPDDQVLDTFCQVRSYVLAFSQAKEGRPADSPGYVIREMDIMTD